MPGILWLATHVFLHHSWMALSVVLAKGVPLFVLAWLATRFFRPLPAEHKHAVWLLVIIAFPVLAAGRIFAPLLPIGLPDWSRLGVVGHVFAVVSAYDQKVAFAIDSSVPDFGPGAVTARPLLLLLPAAAWLGGVVFFVFRYVVGRIALARLAASDNLSQLPGFPLEELAREMRIRRTVTVIHSPRCAVPMTWGWLHPKIALPASFRSWPDARLRAVLLHELTHIKRADCLSNAAVYLVCAALWFNPFAWLARELMLREAELCCDCTVVTHGMRGPEYASAIVETVRSARGDFLVPCAQGILGRKSLLRERILRLLDSGRPAGLVRVGRALLLSFCFLLPLLAFTYFLRATEQLYGAWVERGDSGPYYKLSWEADGRGRLQYDRSASDTWCGTGEFIIEKKWNDPDGNTWYNLKAEWTFLLPWYALIRVDRSGTMCELDVSYDSYPKGFNGPVGSGNHQLYAREPTRAP